MKNRFNWDFSELSAIEEKAACLYEYARESRKIRNTAVSSREPNPRGDSHITVSPSAADLLPFLNRSLGFDVPWQNLSTELRMELAEVFRKRTPKEIIGDLGAKPFVRLDPKTFERFDLPHGLQPDQSVERLSALIYWNYTNDELLEGFKEFLMQHRPAKFPSGKSRGKKDSEWKVRLERLGIMRLLNLHTARSLSGERPEAWQLYKGRRGHEEREGADLYKERTLALKTFYELFPSLHNSIPITSPDADPGSEFYPPRIDERPFSYPGGSASLGLDGNKGTILFQ